jgi:hypothetical protein
MGSPIKRPCQEKKASPPEILLPYDHCLNLPFLHISTFAEVSLVFGVSLYCTSHPSGSRSGEMLCIPQPLPRDADQKIFGSLPRPDDFSQVFWL